MRKIYLFIITLSAGLGGCKDIVDVGLPSNELMTEDIFKDSASVTSAVAGMYSFMYNYQNVEGSPYKNFITTLFSLSADETYYYSGNTYPQFERNAIPVADARNLQLWQDSYKVIYYANNIIENIGLLQSGSAAFRDQVKGEAMFTRAFCFFYLTNIFGDIPLVKTTNLKVSAVMARNPQPEVYKQIVDDLKEARTMLTRDYKYSDEERTRPNYYAATALLARIYLYAGMFTEAASMASEVIDQTASYELDMDLDAIFQSSSREAIFQFPSNVNSATYVAMDFLPGANSGIPNFVLRSQLLNAFEPGDKRRDAWVGEVSYGGNVYAYPGKYRVNPGTPNPSGRIEYDVVLRLSEQYLIRAEARIRMGQFGDAKDDINAIRQRAGVTPIQAGTENTMLQQLVHERQVELFCEWGHRWFDLKRTNQASAVLGTIKPTWKSTAVLFPVPQQAINTNSKLQPQNPGYN